MNGWNFTERIRHVLGQARDETAALNHPFVGTEHILLALLSAPEQRGEGVADAILANAGVDRSSMRATVLARLEPGQFNPAVGPDRAYTNAAKKVLELAMAHARQLSHNYVGTEHLLLALIAEEKGIAAQTLRHAGLTVEGVRAEVVRLLGTPLPAAEPPGAKTETPAAKGVSYLVLIEYADGRIAARRFPRAMDASEYLARFEG